MSQETAWQMCLQAKADLRRVLEDMTAAVRDEHRAMTPEERKALAGITSLQSDVNERFAQLEVEREAELAEAPLLPDNFERDLLARAGIIAPATTFAATNPIGPARGGGRNNAEDVPPRRADSGGWASADEFLATIHSRGPIRGCTCCPGGLRDGAHGRQIRAVDFRRRRNFSRSGSTARSKTRSCARGPTCGRLTCRRPQGRGVRRRRPHGSLYGGFAGGWARKRARRSRRNNRRCASSSWWRIGSAFFQVSNELVADGVGYAEQLSPRS